MADPTVLFNESPIDFLCFLNFGGACLPRHLARSLATYHGLF